MARQGHPCVSAVGLHPTGPGPNAPLPLLVPLILPPAGPRL